MSQQLLPIQNAETPVVTATSGPNVRFNALSEQYIELNNLQSRSTEWTGSRRPIYRRLPAVSETYQIDFRAEGDIGYVYIPYDVGYDGPGSLYVKEAESKTAVLIYGGQIAWKYGPCYLNPVVLDFKVLDANRTKYQIAYQLVYDNAPVPTDFLVDEYSLEGQDLEVKAGTDAIPGWRFNPINAFTTDQRYWTNYDGQLPELYALSPAYIEWSSKYAGAYTRVVARAPVGTVLSAQIVATLQVKVGESWVTVATANVEKDAEGYYFDLRPGERQAQKKWRITWTSQGITPRVSIASILVSGRVTLDKRPIGPQPRAALTLYPLNRQPKTVINTKGEEVPATYCPLADVDLDENCNVLDIEDRRYVVRKEYVPVADWLTEYWDDNTMDIYDQVKNYNQNWLNPLTAMRQEYGKLDSVGIEVLK